MVPLRRRDGLPLDDTHLYKLFWTTALRLSGKRMNPHLVRCSRSLQGQRDMFMLHRQPVAQASGALVCEAAFALRRDSCVSYLRGEGNASERELEALAIYMGHRWVHVMRCVSCGV